MWDHARIEYLSDIEPLSHDAWCAQHLSVAVWEEVGYAWQEAMNLVPSLRSLMLTPQSPPWHAEGAFRIDHIRRMLAHIISISRGARITDIEGLHHKEWSTDLAVIRSYIQEHEASYVVYALLSHILDIDAEQYTSPKGSMGEREGFAEHLTQQTSQDSLNQRYQKRWKAFKAAQGDDFTAFFDQYEIEVRYRQASRQSKELMRTALESLVNHYRLSDEDLSIVRFFLERRSRVLQPAYHRDGFQPMHVTALQKEGTRSGIDGSDISLFFSGMLLIEIVLGSLWYQQGDTQMPVQVFSSWRQAEAASHPEHHYARHQAGEAMDRKRLKEAMIISGLDGDSVAQLLDLPFGPERGKAMRMIEDMIRFPSLETSLNGPYELLQRIHMARTELRHNEGL